MAKYGKAGEAHVVLVAEFLMWNKEYSLSWTLKFFTWITFVIFRAAANQFVLIEPLTSWTRVRLWMSISTDEVLCAAVIIGYNSVIGMTKTNIIIA